MDLNAADFDKLMRWVGRSAHAAHRKYPRGQRFFDPTTRIFRFNIDPNDYFHIVPGVPGVSPPRAERAIPEAYRAMRAVMDALTAKKIKFKVIRISWGAGGSYVQATFPPKR